ncbi:MAG: hypothetical protein ABI625_23230 [bacterium]
MTSSNAGNNAEIERFYRGERAEALRELVRLDDEIVSHGYLVDSRAEPSKKSAASKRRWIRGAAR